ncbi:VasL domain-containing protein [Moellerella wisconsensis]|uniref:VasL domain-containing protein n=1 Tax=Moellerella wisconsensis TaxID=158849 RepID=UPI00307658EC
MNVNLTTLNVGGDPRTFSDYVALKTELNKRFHPARPDIDWARAHGLCLSLFNQNGADLQTAAWFTIIRQQQNGLSGLNDGLSLLEYLLNQHWQTLWPLQTHARIEILSALSQQLISGLRGTVPVYADLPALYQAESMLAKIGKQLQTLELKHLTPLERLQDWLTGQARNLESTNTPDTGFIPPRHFPNTAPTTFHAQTAVPPISIKATLSSNTEKPTLTDKTSPPTYRQGLGRGFLMGLFITGIASSGIFYTFGPWNMNNPITQILPALPEFTPNIASQLDQQLQPNPNQPTSFSNEKLSAIDRYLTELGTVSPIWAQQYSWNMINYLTTQFGTQPEVRVLNDKWQQAMQVNAISATQMRQWSQGMEQLNHLSERLDKLDGKPRSYITGSELKTIIFTARQHFNQGLPLEEELRRLEERQAQGVVPESEYQRIDTHFEQLLNRYTLLRYAQEKS